MRRVVFFLFCFMMPVVLMGQQSREQLASHYFSQGEYEQAIELYESLYKSTSNKFYYEMLVRSYLILEEYKDAESLITKRLKQFPQDLTLYVDLGQVFESKGDSKKSRRYYEKAVSELAMDSKQASQLAEAFASVHLYDWAQRTYSAIRDNTRNRYLFVNEMAAIYGRQGDYASLVSEYFALIDHSPRSMESVQVSLQRMMHDAGDDSRLVDALRTVLVDRLQGQPDNRQNIDMMIWFSLQQKDFDFALAQAQAMDRRFADLQGDPVWRVAEVSRSNSAYEVSQAAYAYLVSKGPEAPHYMDSRVGELQVRFARFNEGPQQPAQLRELCSDYEAAIAELGKREATIPLLRDYASLLAFQKHDMQAAVDVLYDILEMDRLKPKVRDEVKLDLGDMMLVAGEVWEASLLYMQVEKANKDDVLGSMAKLCNAKLSYYHHDFTWAKSQLDVLRASTSKLVANDAMELSLLISDNMEEDSTFDMLELFADADLLRYRGLLDSAWLQYDEISHRVLSHPLLDDVLMRKAQIRIQQERYEEADTLLGMLYSFYPDDVLADDALFMRGTLAADKLHHFQQAASYFEKLLMDYPSSIFVDRARSRYNELKKNHSSFLKDEQ